MKQRNKARDFANRLHRQQLENAGREFWPAWRRLESARKKAREHTEKHGAGIYSDWRRHVARVTKDTGAGRCNDGSGDYYAYGTGAFGCYLGNVPDVMRAADSYRWHDYATGYYTDGFCDGVLSGGVEKVRCPRGTLYVPVASHSDWDSATYYFSDAVLVPKGASESDHSEAMREAARAADSKAEREAESEREHNDAWQAGREWADAGDDMKAARGAFLAIRKDARANGPAAPTLCGAIRNELARLARQYREAKEKREELAREWGAAWRRELWASFNDGADANVLKGA